jgi:hypothetical protein
MVGIDRLVEILLAGSLLAAGYASASVLPDVEVKTNFPVEVHVNLMPPVQNNGFVDQKIHATLKNNSGKELALTASTPCDVSNWQIIDSSGATNQVKVKPEICIQQFVAVKVGSGQTYAYDDVIHIDGKKLSDGAPYKFRYELFGYETETRFTAVVTH